MSSKKSPVLVSYDIFRNPKTDKDLIKRLNFYGENLFKYTEGSVSGLTIISTSKIDKITHKKEILQYINFLNPHINIFCFFLYIREYFKFNRNTISLIICGDPWLDFFLIKLATMNLSLRVQVSIHGEPYLVSNFKKNLVSFLKNIWLQRFLRKADSVRLVSEHQIDPIIKNYKVKKSKIIIAPIPVLIPTEIPNLNRQRKSIIFLGRMHNERGLDLWLNLITELYKIRQDFDLLIIGDGELREEFENSFARIHDGPRYRFFGWIEQHKLMKYLINGKVLLNTAPTESYGASMREAQMLGLSIVSYANNGALANLAFFGRGIHIFHNTVEGISQLNRALDEKLSLSTIQNYRAKQFRMNARSSDILTRSWLGLKNI